MMSLSDEFWKPVPGMPGWAASSHGRIRRGPVRRRMPNGGTRLYSIAPTFGVKARTTGIVPFRMTYRVRLTGRTYKVARLVCAAFHGPCPFRGAVAMHADDNPVNNRPTNLSWGTQKRNLNAPQFVRYCKSGAPGNRRAA